MSEDAREGRKTKRALVLWAFAIMLVAAVITGGVAADELVFALRLGNDLTLVELDEGQKITVLLIADPGTECIAMPAGAKFDPIAMKFTWIADFDQKGVHVAAFVGTIDGIPEESYIIMSVHDYAWKPDAATALPVPEYLWPPNNKMVPVDIIITDPLGNKVPIVVDSVIATDTIRKVSSMELLPGKSAQAKGIVKKTMVQIQQHITKAMKGADYRVENGTLYLLAGRPGFVIERAYEVTFTATHPKTGMSDSGMVTFYVPHDMSGFRPKTVDTDEEEEEAQDEKAVGKADEGGKPGKDPKDDDKGKR